MKKTYVIPDRLMDVSLWDISVAEFNSDPISVDEMDVDGLALLIETVADAADIERIEPGHPDFAVSTAELGLDYPDMPLRGIYILRDARGEVTCKLVLEIDNPHCD